MLMTVMCPGKQGRQDEVATQSDVITALVSTKKTCDLKIEHRESLKSVIRVIRGVPARDPSVICHVLHVIRGFQILKKGRCIVFFFKITNIRITRKT